MKLDVAIAAPLAMFRPGLNVIDPCARTRKATPRGVYAVR
ncbi:MAG: hypothetical protein ACI9OJ_003859 [Myxococcota bacterium]|jgi:hypothetical protein